MYSFVADAIVFVHVLYVAYVVVGQAVILGAGTFRTQWGRNPWFRWTHLGAIGIVAFEEVMGWRCPLTTWEEQFRTLAGQQFHTGETFMQWLCHEIIFAKSWPQEVFAAVHISFCLIVIQAVLLYPPRMFRSAWVGRMLKRG